MTEKSVYKDILYGYLFLYFAQDIFAIIASFVPYLVKGPSALLFQGLLLIFLLAASCEAFRRMKTFPDIPWWTWLIVFVALNLLQFLPIIARPRLWNRAYPNTLCDTARLLFPVIISIFAWRKNQETPSYFLYGILLGFITGGACWVVNLAGIGLQWTGAPYWVVVLLMTLLAFSFIAFVLLRKQEFPQIGKNVMVLSIIAGVLYLCVELFAPAPPETIWDLTSSDFRIFLMSWHNFVRVYLLALFVFAYCCFKLIKAKTH